MTVRWWSRAIGPTIVAALLAGSAVSAAADAGGPGTAARWELVGRTAEGAVVLRVPLPDGRFTLEYRNSLYGSPAAEHFAVTADGRLALVGLAAMDPAILQEYYGATGTTDRATTGRWAGWWHAPASAPLELAELTVAASRHGERTLVAGPGGVTRIALWRTVDAGDPAITLEAHPAG